ncbi:MAG: glutamine amidotransferase-related protein [Bilophila wadsworthia]
MFLLIDNYDSCTYNLVQAFYALGQDPVVVKNDDPRLLELAQDPSLNMVCLSPGPGHPKDAGYCMEVLRILDPKVPVLGVCLGHQALGLAAGAEIVVGPCIMHGKASEIVHDGSGLFSGVPNPMRVGRYHSLVVRSDVDEAHAKFTVTAHGPEGEIMALRYKDRPWVGVQFHPESILTPDGLRLLGNFPKAILPAGNDANAINVILDTLASGQDLTADMASAGFSALMDGTMTPSQAGSFLMGLRMKGETPGAPTPPRRAGPGQARGRHRRLHRSRALRRRARPSTAPPARRSRWRAGIRWQTATAPSSKCSSADAGRLTSIWTSTQPKGKTRRPELVFLRAAVPPCFRNIAPIRNELGIRTLFNLLGP